MENVFKGSKQKRLYGQELKHKSTGMSESELAKKIIYLHDVVGLGFRRISKKLELEGIYISKDTAWRLYHKYKPDYLEVEGDEELKQLKEAEACIHVGYQPFHPMYQQQYPFYPMNHQHQLDSWDQLIRVMQYLYMWKCTLAFVELMLS